MKREIADNILRDTEAGYDSISEKFSQTRKHFWRGLEFLKDYTQAGDKVFDFGCGNGRLLELIGDAVNIEYYGTDVSGKLIEIAKNKYCSEYLNVCHPALDAGSSSTTQADKVLDSRFHGNDKVIHFTKTDPGQRTLPFEAGFFNTAYSIAVFHHFPSKEYRKEMARELYRITESDGCVVITVWNLWQKKYFKNIVENWKNKILGRSKLDFSDCLIPFTDNQGKVFHRYHHAFTKRELKKLFGDVGFKTEKCEVVAGRNMVYVGKK